ncbi:MAG: multicopper oxidase family protein [Flavisolibacter sp.]
MSKKNQTIAYNLVASQFSWEIAPEKSIEAWGFNNQFPGPTLKARKGDTLVVKVKNDLSEPTIVHWHGIRLPASMDGTDEAQKTIEPGEEFEYRFELPDSGTFWYHSHANETVQMERGMYGALIVEDDNDPVIDNDKVFLIDDLKLAKDNSFKIPKWSVPKLKETHDGRQGNTLLINGKEKPVIDIAAGQMERWRFINSSSARYFNLSLGGREFKIIGTDGGLLEKVRIVNNVLITPGERIDIIAGPFNEGEVIPIDSLPYNRMTFLKAKHDTFATINVGSNKPSKAFIPEILRRIEPLAPKNATVTRKVKFSVGPSFKNGLNFLVNNELHSSDQPVYVGELQVWEVNNVSMMDHPFHLHGFFFQVLEINGKEPEYLSWKDTINLTPRTKVKIAWMPDNRPGNWMYHCHILEHHAAGMMGHFEVIDKANPVIMNKMTNKHHHH